MIEPHSEAAWPRAATVTLLVAVGLALTRTTFCFFVPDVIGGREALTSDLDLITLATPFTILGYYCILVKHRYRTGAALLIPGLYLLGAVSMFRTQVAIFYVGRHSPLIDNVLGNTDAFLGFSWTAYFRWVIDHCFVLSLLTWAYKSIWVQPFLICVILIAQRRIIAYLTIQTALPLSFAITCIVATILPALGAYQFHGMSPDQHTGVVLEFTDQMTAPMQWLRQEELPNTLPAFRDLRLITFPSWHAAAAIIFVMAVWPTIHLRCVVAALNGLLLLGTPVQGSHYLTDILIGLLVGAAAYSLSRRLMQSHAFLWRIRQEQKTRVEPQLI